MQLKKNVLPSASQKRSIVWWPALPVNNIWNSPLLVLAKGPNGFLQTRIQYRLTVVLAAVYTARSSLNEINRV